MFSCCRYGACGRSTTIQFVLDGTLELYYGLKRNRSGIESLISIQERFKIRSEINPQFPGTLYDGGELGYSLSFAQGSVMGDKEKSYFV